MGAQVELKHKNSAITKPTENENENEESWQVSTWTHRAWLATGCAAVLFTLAKSLHLLTLRRAPTRLWLESIFAGLIGYAAADLGSGVYHWAIDNYGGPETPIFGPQIEDFQGHHQQPWAITKRQLANKVYLAAAAAAAAVVPISLLSGDPVVLAFVGVYAGCVMFTQQFHAWAHTPKRKLPPLVAALQDAGVLLAPQQHAAHHRPPYNNNYCIVSGVWNGFLDRSGFFLGLEVLLHRVFGYMPRSWSGPISLGGINQPGID